MDRPCRAGKIGWWVTSALESNVGLNAIAQWTFTTGNKMPQGLGTGGLYTNNFESPLKVKERAHYL
jgi:o-succinylbenzoate synthase